MNGMITEIQHGSVHDGPGLRTVIFLKGCQFGCFWCHNPETISARSQRSFDEPKCIKCGRCLAGHACPAGALSTCGQEVSVDEVMRDVVEDKEFFLESGGGVTVSGGEPGCQPKFTAEILRRCHEEGIHTALETNLGYERSVLETMIVDCDLLMADLKHIDPEKHRGGTGRDNEEVLENLRFLTGKVILRTPVVSGFNDDVDTIRRIAEFAAGLKNLEYYELLSYHPLGCEKAKKLGMTERERQLPLPENTDNLISAAYKTGVPLLFNGKRIK